MDWWEWILWVLLVTSYIMCLFTICRLTFQKGHTVLGIVGIFIPFRWLIGAILPPKRGSQFELAQQRMYQARVQKYSS